MPDIEKELAAIRQSAAIAPITDRAFLRITGSDATRWLNGMVTNSIQSLQPGEGNYNFLLNAQGRIQGDCTIYREPLQPDPTFLLETDTTQLDAVHQLLEKFIIMDDVELKRGIHISGAQADPNPVGIAIIGTKGPELLMRVIETSVGESYVAPGPGSMTFGSLEGNKVIILTRSDADVLTFEVWCDSRGLYGLLYKKLDFHNVPSLSPEALEAHRILTSTPKYGIDIRNTETARDLPQETAQTHALHFAKGCYLGQEIVERIRSRGQVHRTFTQFRLTGTLPTLPAKLEANGKPAGELTSAIQIGDDIIALGYARREALATNQPLTYPGGTATQTQIPQLTSQD